MIAVTFSAACLGPVRIIKSRPALTDLTSVIEMESELSIKFLSLKVMIGFQPHSLILSRSWERKTECLDLEPSKEKGKGLVAIL